MVYREDKNPRDFVPALRRALDGAGQTRTRPHGVTVLGPQDRIEYHVPGSDRVVVLDGATVARHQDTLQWAAIEVDTAQERLDEAEVTLGEARGRIDQTAGHLAELEIAQGELVEQYEPVVGRLDSIDGTLGETQGVLDDLKPRLGVVEKTASDAGAKADQAMTSASGKSTIRHSTSTPQGAGLAEGDMWMQWDRLPGGSTIGQWFWDGSAWQQQTLSHRVISSVDLGTATVGELDGLRIRGHSIESNKLTIGVGQNAIADPMFSSAEFTDFRVSESVGPWTQNRSGDLPFMEATGTDALAFSYAGYSFDRATPTVAGQGWRIRVRVNPGGGRARANVRWFNSAGDSVYEAASSFVSGTEDTEISTIWEAPAAAAGFSVVVYSPRELFSRTVRVYAGISVQSMTGAVLIEDGAITGPKVNARSVAGVIGQFVEVEAENVKVTNTLTTRVFDAIDTNTVTAFVRDRLVVQGSMDILGPATVNELNALGTLHGTDAILTGTIDVTRLNVTEEMTAKLVAAMSVATKKLVVTEEAILQHTTVIGGLVVDLLSAGDVTISGTFRSGSDTGAGVIIPKAYTTNASQDQVGIWLTHDGKAPSMGADWGAAAGIWMDQAGIASPTATLPIHLRGRNGGGVNVYGELRVSSKVGIPLAVVKGAKGTPMQIEGDNGQTVTAYADKGGSARLYVSNGSGDATVQANGTGAARLWASGSGDARVVSTGSGNVRIYAEGKGNVDVDAAGTMDIRGGSDANLKAGYVVNLRSGVGTVSETGGYVALRNLAGDAYGKGTPSSGSWVSLFMDTSNGRVYRSTSAAKYKARIEPWIPPRRFLDMPVYSYVDAADPENGRVQVGTLADEAEQYGAGALVAYGPDGEVEDYRYEREVVALRYFLRDALERIERLESRVVR